MEVLNVNILSWYYIYFKYLCFMHFIFWNYKIIELGLDMHACAYACNIRECNIYMHDVHFVFNIFLLMKFCPKKY